MTTRAKPPEFERVGMIWRVARPGVAVPRPTLSEMLTHLLPDLPPSHVLRVLDTTGQHEEYDVEIWVHDDEEAWRRARELATQVPPPARVRLYRSDRMEASLGGIRGAAEA